MSIRFSLILFLQVMFCAPVLFAQETIASPKVKPGITVLVEERASGFSGRRVGLVTNITGVDAGLNSSIDLINGLPGVKLVALFAPEHGIRGGMQDFIANETDEKTGVPVFSLHGVSRRPSAGSFKGLDILFFDIQDIGSRSYTYITTMKYCMEEAAKSGIKFVVLDRPNPVNGLIVDGPVLEPGFESFIGAAPIAYLHGMTIGELAGFFNKELGIGCDLEVIPMKGWKRTMTWKDTGLPWVPTSPHIPEPDTPWFYPVTGIFGELLVVSVGVGYTLPFKIVGAPWMNSTEITSALNSRKIRGVYFQPFHFTPYYSLFKGEFCRGFRIIITDEKLFRPVETAYHIMDVLFRAYPEKFNLSLSSIQGSVRMFDNANGSSSIRKMLDKGVSAEKIIESYRPGLDQFIGRRKKYLLYP